MRGRLGKVRGVRYRVMKNAGWEIENGKLDMGDCERRWGGWRYSNEELKGGLFLFFSQSYHHILRTPLVQIIFGPTADVPGQNRQSQQRRLHHLARIPQTRRMSPNSQIHG